MKKYIRCLVIVKMLILATMNLSSQTIIENPQRWDQFVINESIIWKNLLHNYNCFERTQCWEDREKALLNVIENYPNSKWIDDAKLMLAGEKGIIGNNFDEAIQELRQIQKDYPTESTIIDGWNLQRGCHINEAWLMWVPGLVVFDENDQVRKIFPYDRDENIDDLEMELIMFFEHLDKNPQLTIDVAQYIIALILQQKGDISSAIVELELLRSRKDLKKLRSTDFKAAKEPNGRLIESTPPLDVYPIWRIEYAASFLLLELYTIQGENEKVLELAKKISDECSPDGWYWNMNKKLGVIYSNNDYQLEATKQYDLSINGILERSKSHSIKMKDFYEKGLAVKSKDFVSWEEEALKIYTGDLNELRELKKSAQE